MIFIGGIVNLALHEPSSVFFFGTFKLSLMSMSVLMYFFLFSFMFFLFFFSILD